MARYDWIVDRLGDLPTTVLDVACGVGYGTQLLAEAGHTVLAIDNDVEALAYAREHYWHERARYKLGDITRLEHALKDATYDVAVAFECIEHVSDPLPMLVELRRHASVLYASVPNEAVFPYQGDGYRIAYHHRHYTSKEFKSLLNAAGWHIDEWHGQADGESDVEPCLVGRTLIAKCTPVRDFKDSPLPVLIRTDAVALPIPPSQVPRTVAILGLGPSLAQYVDVTKRLGARNRLADETWGINAVGDVIQCDRLFHMDDFRIQEIRAKEAPESNIANMLTWMKTYNKVIYTSQANPDYPASVDYPLEDVINSCGGLAYFNNTAAYAVAFAIHIGVKKIQMFGCDFTYPDAHDAEKGRGCVEFWLGFAAAKGIKIATARTSSLLDAYAPIDERIYGYDCVNLKLVESNGHTRVEFSQKDAFPTAAEIEDRYDHGKHPNAIVEGEA